MLGLFYSVKEKLAYLFFPKMKITEMYYMICNTVMQYKESPGVLIHTLN